MKIVKVTYTTKAGYAEQNKANIQKVMNDLQAINNPNISYTACIGEDGKTFTHFAFFKTDEDRKVLGDLPSFKSFQEQLKASGPEVPPQQESPSFVGSSTDLFRK
jgi:hypothetical protein